ncbi:MULTISPECIES: glycosyltransferase [Pacificibacter]|uniref:glycosyltransferase n=1 Tax=Pacificibacter TaxID=1042323 RepID=UPI001C098E02|nr:MULTISPECIES: glycosyltransferase [Pacificibacter]MBU2937400.1 glycosyltransferase [Pacificibacter marinus]MDO6617042.1 glycosyltransferase [Pacificibacter sp. 1_MG-2023]
MVALVIPVYNGGELYRQCLQSVNRQACQFSKKLVMESGSSDASRELSIEYGFDVYDVPAGTFNHGGTRSDAVEMIDDEIIVFITQDAILDNPDAIKNLIKCFDNSDVGAVYGRQLPHNDGNPLAIHARTTSYGPESYVASMESDYPVGIRKCFMSNSFAAYRRSALLEVGGFPDNVILSEDMYAVAKMLKLGWKIAYAADARAQHSHNYSVGEEFRRYFDIGVFQSQEDWILETFGSPEGEGIRVVLHQFGFLMKHGHFLWIPRAFFAAGAKFLGYKLGRKNERLGPNVSRKLAMHRAFFKR